MKVLITGAGGFVGRNLAENLKNIRDGKDKTHPGLIIEEIYEVTRSTSEDELKVYCRDADFIFNLAGVNRPKETSEFEEGNCGFLEDLLSYLKDAKNTCPVMLSSSTQASLEGRFANSEYGKSKLKAEEILKKYGDETGADVLIYRFPNLFGKWCRPNYNSAVATFCDAIANEKPYTVNDESTELTLMYIDDVVAELISQLEFVHEPRYVEHKATLGEIIHLLKKFSSQPSTLIMPEIPESSFEKKLYSTYLSYLPKEKAVFSLKMNTDERGSFTELLKTENCGQFSVNISKPGITKGQHWHNTKWEFFIVVSGHGLIEQRKIGSDEVLKFEVSRDNIQSVHMLPGYTHNIINLSDEDDLVTLMWANEQFNPDKPDTFFEEV